MRYLYLGFAISDDMLARLMRDDANMPAQTHNFGWALIGALSSSGGEVDVLGFEPVVDYPNNPRVRVRGARFTRGSFAGETVSFVNLTGLKHLTRYISLRAAVRRHDPSRVQAVVVHGVHSPHLLVARRLARKHGIPAIAVLTDPPSVPTIFDNVLARLMKRLDFHVITSTLKKVDGVVSLTPQLARDLAPGVPSLWMEGIAPQITLPANDHPADTPLVVYAGVLNAEYGVADLLAAADLGAGRWHLDLYGKGPLESEVTQVASVNPHVRFGGSVGKEELRRAYARASVLVNPRPSTFAASQYSFPSKLIEFLATGRPVVSTRLPSIPADYSEHLTYADDGPDGINEAIIELIAGPPAELDRRGAAAKSFIERTRGESGQGRRIADFIALRSR